MTFVNGQAIDETDFIKESERNATPANDAERAVKLESDGKLDSFFTRMGDDITYGETINGATLPVPVFINSSTGKVLASDANDSTRYRFDGFALENGVVNDVKKVRFSGIVGGFSGLTKGSPVYVQDAVGTIGHTPGTMQILVGVATSATEVFIQKGRRRAAGNGGSLGTASGSLAVSCGFRPSIVRIVAHAASNNYTSCLEFTYVNGAVSAVARHQDDGSGHAVSNDERLYGDATSNYMTFSITGVTDTGFTINWTETSTFPGGGSAFFKWEAEGEQ